MKIFTELKELVRIEKKYTRAILKKLMIIEKDKIYADLKYPSLHKFLIKELGYSEAEATLRVNVCRLMLKSKIATAKIESGQMSLANAAEANKASNYIKDEKKIKTLIEKASVTTTRQFKEIVDFELKRERKEIIVLREYMLKKFDRLKKKYGDVSNYELINIMLEKELTAPASMQRLQKTAPRNSRSIPRSVKVKVYNGKCANCDVKHGLEYDHIKKHSHFGDNSAKNIQLLCRSCNTRKEIIAKRSGFFA